MKWVLVLIFLMISSVLMGKTGDVRSCSLATSSYNFFEGELSDRWAFELIGADLLKKDLEELPPLQQKNFVAVFDESYGEHDIKVRNIVSDEGPHSVLPELGDKSIPIFRVLGSPSENYTYTAKKLRSAAVPSFINSSKGWKDASKAVYNAFKSLSPPAVVVTSAGNRFPARTDEAKVKASRVLDVVVVGSLSPDGFVSAFSQAGKEVHILAPSDHYLNSANGEGEYRLFGKTSGAAPIVTASLAGFAWLSGYRPKPQEAKILLTKTAIPTVHSHENPRINGIGLVNSYKLGRVGMRLKDICAGQTSPGPCFRREIKKQEIYNFHAATHLENDLARFFPQCSMERVAEDTKEDAKSATCENKRLFFNRLRKAVLLRPHRRDLWQMLSCIYRDGGFYQNAELLDHIALSLGPTKEVIKNLKVLIRGKKGGRGALRALVALGGREEGNKIVQKLAQSNDQDSNINAAYLAGDMKNSLGDRRLQQLAKNSLSSVRYHVAIVLGFTLEEREERLRILRELARDTGPKVQKAATMMLRKHELSGRARKK